MMTIQHLTEYTKSVPCLPSERKSLNDDVREISYSLRRVRSRKRTAHEAFSACTYERALLDCQSPAADDTDTPLDLSMTGCHRQTSVDKVTLRTDISRVTSSLESTEDDENVLPIVEVVANSVAFKKTLLQRYNASVLVPSVTAASVSPIVAVQSWNDSIKDEEESSFSINSTNDYSCSSPLVHFCSSIDPSRSLYTPLGVNMNVQPNLSKSQFPHHENLRQQSLNLLAANTKDVNQLDPLIHRTNGGSSSKFKNLDLFEINNQIEGSTFSASGKLKQGPVIQNILQQSQGSRPNSLHNIFSPGGWMTDSTSHPFEKRTSQCAKLNVEQPLGKRARQEPEISYSDLPSMTIKTESFHHQKDKTCTSNFEEDDFEYAESTDGRTPTLRRRRQGSGTSYLWQFLLELLANSEYSPSCISWVDRRTGTFRLSDTKMVSKLWGLRKNRPSMSYETMGRALRYYYTRGILNRVQGQRLVYQFAKLPAGYSF